MIRLTVNDKPVNLDQVSQEPMVSIECPKCNGRGVYRAMYGGYVGGCNRCKGKKVIQVSLLEAKQREAAAAEKLAARDRKVYDIAANAAAWRAANPAEAAWLAAQADAGLAFAQSLLAGLQRYGALTPNQLAAVQRNVAQASAPRAAGPAAAPAASMPEVEAAFSRARAKGVKFPKMRMAGFTMSPASESSANAGAIYVKSSEGVYLGKVLGGVFSKSRDCSPELQAKVLEVAKDPKAAAVAYGKEYGVCSVCGRELSDAASVERGIGPVCAERMGW